MQERYRHRQQKLPEYKALIDILGTKGENVTDLQQLWTSAHSTQEEDAKAMDIFQKVATEMMSFNFMAIA